VETLLHLWPPVRLTLELATISTLSLLILATPLAWWLARSKNAWKEVIATIVSLPLVLPPTVLGFYILIALGPDGPGGMIATFWGARTMAFTFQGLVVGCIVSALPVVVQPIRNAFAAIGDRPLEAAATLRASPRKTFWRVALPLSSPGLLSGAVLGFANIVGNFGVVLMIGGNIPGRTRVMSTAIFDYVETMQWREANILAGGMVVFAFVVILSMILIQKRALRGLEHDFGAGNSRRVPQHARKVHAGISLYGSSHRRHDAVRAIGLRQDHCLALHRRAESHQGRALRHRRRDLAGPQRRLCSNA
jgi:molybdate transport system permease protein